MTTTEVRGHDYESDRRHARILKRDHYICQCAGCRASGRVLLATRVEMIVPKAKGGTYADSNLQSMNVDCHKVKALLERCVHRPARWPSV